MTMICQCDMCEGVPEDSGEEFDEIELLIYSSQKRSPFEGGRVHLCEECLIATLTSMRELNKLIGGTENKEEE